MSNDTKDDAADIRAALIDLVNEIAKERLSAGGSVPTCAFVPVSDRHIVSAEDASDEQWQAAADWLLEETLKKVVPGLEGLILLLVMWSIHSPKGAREFTNLKAGRTSTWSAFWGGSSPDPLEEAYRELGVEPGADPVVIREAFRRERMRRHPDRGGTHEDMTRLIEAYRRLGST